MTESRILLLFAVACFVTGLIHMAACSDFLLHGVALVQTNGCCETDAAGHELVPVLMMVLVACAICLLGLTHNHIAKFNINCCLLHDSAWYGNIYILYKSTMQQLAHNSFPRAS